MVVRLHPREQLTYQMSIIVIISGVPHHIDEVVRKLVKMPVTEYLAIKQKLSDEAKWNQQIWCEIILMRRLVYATDASVLGCAIDAYLNETNQQNEWELL
jgi:hypothetical protein